jgi:hypothetical protein
MESENRLFNYIREGMPVFDVEGNRIGEVEVVFAGGLRDDHIESGADSATSPALDAGQPDNWVGMLREVFAPIDLPRELVQRLLNNGYLLIDGGGLLAADRLVLPEQIDSVGADGVHLNALRNDLPRA